MPITGYSAFGHGVSVYDVGLIRHLCETIRVEPDDEKAQHLLDLLNSIVRENDEEIVLRLEFLRKKYAFAFKKAASA